MWTQSCSKIYPGVTKEAVWKLWTDVNNWPRWDTELEYCQMQGAFAKDSQFILKPVGGPKVKIILSEVVPYETFTDYCTFFGATMHDYHHLEETPDGLRITNTITVTGPLGLLWTHLVAKNVAKAVPRQMDALAELAKASHD
ncbi:hypothetical protein AQUSIP_25370 [Aquicella siphonis]|uniref:Polyketide cyclase n=1 Tax=Aquicella siphonis TaxID=254247 RepID=A0A5E4PJJ7_9COXI|nr:SRPBCC family protein [Aquicella siphonis]VVC77210.1 hypothetical protein AQUSIP_25370 [Aquicella siphonis]